MAISIAQLNILAEKFGFDINDAREAIGLPVKRGRATEPADCGSKCARPPTVSDVVKPKKATNKATNAVEKKPGAPRGKTGYNLYMADAKVQVNSDLRSGLENGGKLAPGAVASEIGRRWKNLPEGSRAIWNGKASV
jgi:hypothetical protein